MEQVLLQFEFSHKLMYPTMIVLKKNCHIMDTKLQIFIEVSARMNKKA